MNKGTDKQYVAVFLLHNSTHHYQAFYQNFRILNQWVAEIFFDRKNVHMYFIGVTERKFEKLEKRRQMKISILISVYTILFAYLKVYTKFKNTGSKRSREI